MTKCLKLIVFLLVSANPRLLGPYAKLFPVLLGWKNEWNVFVRVSLHFESRSRKALNSCLFFLSHARDRTMFTLHYLTDFLHREGERTAFK